MKKLLLSNSLSRPVLSKCESQRKGGKEQLQNTGAVSQRAD